MTVSLYGISCYKTTIIMVRFFTHALIYISGILRKLYTEVRGLKKIIFFILVLIIAILSFSGCSTNNNTGPSASGYGPGTAIPGTDRVSNVPRSTDATLNPLISPASTF